MILATHGFLASSIGQIDADAQAFFNRVTTAGGTLSATERNAVNTLVIQMKTDGIWTKMKAIYPMVGASAAACAQNLKSSSFTGTFTSGWTFASTGVTPNGTSAYMNTNFVPNSNLTLNSGHLSFYSRTNNNTGVDDIGAAITTDLQNMRLIIRNGGSLFCDLNSGTTARISGSNANSLGFYIGSRTTSTTFKVFKNNTTFGTNTNTNNGTQPIINLYIGCLNGNGIPQNYSNRECAFASLGDGLTDTEASNFYTAVQAFQTTLSRQV
jgi:hypothetical protein